MKKLQPNKQSNLEDFQKEINTIRSLHCDYIVKYRGVCYSMGKNIQINSYTKTPITLFVGYNATYEIKVICSCTTVDSIGNVLVLSSVARQTHI